jgi:hypothetical protein
MKLFEHLHRSSGMLIGWDGVIANQPGLLGSFVLCHSDCPVRAKCCQRDEAQDSGAGVGLEALMLAKAARALWVTLIHYGSLVIRLGSNRPHSQLRQEPLQHLTLFNPSP